MNCDKVQRMETSTTSHSVGDLVKYVAATKLFLLSVRNWSRVWASVFVSCCLKERNSSDTKMFVTSVFFSDVFSGLVCVQSELYVSVSQWENVRSWIKLCHWQNNEYKPTWSEGAWTTFVKTRSICEDVSFDFSVIFCLCCVSAAVVRGQRREQEKKHSEL